MLMGPGWFRRQNSDDHSRNRCHHALCAGVGPAGYGRHYTGTKPETVDTRQADALRSRPVLSYSETGRSLVRIQSPRPNSQGLFRTHGQQIIPATANRGQLVRVASMHAANLITAVAEVDATVPASMRDRPADV